ncbi:glycosyltransferase [Nocardioides KLBMP 9356]|uniref:Glycosyltransferase n=1 Tax=Nocardioides potassii TaxID=2911371 RepID=A0ABS9H7W3_9ACTN|nr:glycosyltransferase [Nocardioides potassii]MCF6376280.1 glycosyltransferase [Nocardioides potassii]
MRPDDIACSIVIPTLNAADLIGEQLEALADQPGAPTFEVLVSDNGSTDDLAGVVERYSEVLPGLRRVDASRGRGVSVARNVGVEAAASDRVLICDADDRVSRGWVRAMHAALDSAPLVSGPVETTELSGRSAGWVPIAERTEGLFEVWGHSYGIGANLGLRRSVWSEVGGFAEDYPAGAEEIDFAWRAADRGHLFTYVPDALVHYRIRTDLRGVLRQQYNSGRGTATLYSRFKPESVVPKSVLRRTHHELMLLRQFPLRGGPDARRRWLTLTAFEAGKLVEARRLGIRAP